MPPEKGGRKRRQSPEGNEYSKKGGKETDGANRYNGSEETVGLPYVGVGDDATVDSRKKTRKPVPYPAPKKRRPQ